MVQLGDILDIEELAAEISAGYVTRRLNDNGALAILNYSNSAQYDRRWNDTTKACRGLIYDTETLEVIARPYPKFFNHNEDLAPNISEAEWFTVMDKADGSLVIAAIHNGELVAATRGSFMSEQAIAARKILAGVEWTPPPGMTYTFELVGPGNRIVLSYPEDTLIHLGRIDNETGHIYMPEGETPFDSAQVFTFESLRDVFVAPPRPNAEGYVIYTDRGIVKWKQEDYVQAHRLVTNLTPKNIWRAMVAGKTLAAIKEPFPDEFFDEIDAIYKGIAENYMAINDEAMSAYLGIDPALSQKDFAAVVKEYPRHIQGLLFSTRAGKSIHNAILRMIEPKGDSPRVTE